MPATRERLTWCLGGCALVGAALLGFGGAAARPGGLLIGLPPRWDLVGVVLAFCVILLSTHARVALGACAGLLLPIILLLVGVPLAGVRALSGPPLLALALAGVAVVASRSPLRPPRWLLLPAVFLVYTLVAGRTQLQVGPQGDEPHYLMVAESLLRDGDLSLEKDYAEQRYTAFHDAPLAPHYRVRGRGGAIYSLHAVGLSVLILPAYALAGYVGASVFMALLAALLAHEVREWVRGLSGKDGLAEAAGWAFALSPPLIHYAGLVFTEVPAALALAFALRRAREERLGRGAALAIGLAVAVLPWLNIRYAPLSALLLFHAMWRHRDRRTAAALAVAPLVSAAGLMVYHEVLYGFLDPRRVYGRRPELALSTLREGLPGLLLDQEFGLLVYAPVFALAVPGLVFLWRRDRRQGVVVLALILVTLLTAGTWHMWRGGFNPPARLLVPVIPALAAAVAMAWDRRGLTAGAALLVGWSLWTGLTGAWEPCLVHRDRDGTARLFRERSGAREWTGLLPGYVLEDPERNRLAVVWAVALTLALPWRPRALSAARVAAAGLVWMVAAQTASWRTQGSTGDRDAVRVVGRKAMSLPGWNVVPAAAAEWGCDALGWGPLYEPHRHPDGADLGRRLPLRVGRYVVVIDSADLGGSGAGPKIVMASDRPRAPLRIKPLEPGARGWSATFDVLPGEHAMTLRILGGRPLLIRGLRLEALNPGSPGRSNLTEARGGTR
jgi:hypothetical protein